MRTIILANPWTGQKYTVTKKSQLRELEMQPSILLRDYTQRIDLTDTLPQDDLSPVLMGLFGEVGSVMATAKKLHREDRAYAGSRRHALIEEFGDTLWYFTTLCIRLNYRIEEIFLGVTNGEGYKEIVAASDLPDGPLSRITTAEGNPSLDELLLKLGEAAASLLSVKKRNSKTLDLLRIFAGLYLRAIQVAKVPFAEIVCNNIEKVRGRFLEFNPLDLPTFDSDFPEEERLPEHFEIKIIQRKSGKSYMQWNGVFIGDPLTDNIPDPDGYRFHDVFHLSYAAILHWSPIFRKLIKQKRKSDPRVDEAQDGGRATVVEEGLSAWIFSRAKKQSFFENQESLSFDILKVVQEFVRGYEVEKCPLSLWEYAILEGYKVFREVRKNKEGIVIGDRRARTIIYKPIEETGS